MLNRILNSRAKYLLSSCTLLLCCLLLSTHAVADSRTYKQYIYDEAGNIIGVYTDVSDTPPSVFSLSPTSARIGGATTLVATGEGLFGVKVTPSDSSVRIKVLQTDSTEVEFEFVASNNTPIGPYQLTFTTGLGSTSQNVEVQPALPGISVAPSPIVLAPGSGAVSMDVRLTSADIMDHTINFTIGDPGIASLSDNSITIPAGATEPSTVVSVTPLALGNTSLEMTSSSLTNLAVPVFITGEYTPPTGANTFYNQLLGVELDPGPLPPEFIPRGPFSATLSVFKENDIPPPEQSVSPVLANQLGVIRTNHLIEQITPATLVNGTGPVPLVVTGIGLDSVTAVQAVPPDGLTFDTPSANIDGTELTIPVTIATDAPTGLRQLVLSAGTERVPVIAPYIDRFNVADLLPVITSIDPIVVVRDSLSVGFTVRGRNLKEIQSIQIVPETGTVDTEPTSNEEGTELYFNLSVPPTTPLGSKNIIVTNLVGSSDSTPSEANSFSVVNVPGDSYPYFKAPVLGVTKESSEHTIIPRGDIRSALLGVSYGGVITGISPTSKRIGENFTLTIQGSGLEGVDVVAFVPDDGITMTPIDVAADGRSITFDVAIAPDAPETVRRLVVVDDGVVIPSTPADANLFSVTGFEPVIQWVSPNSIVIGASPVQMRIRGEYFANAASVRALPETEGISISPPVVNAEGTEITVDISVAAGVNASEKVVVVQTASGISNTSIDHTNRLRLVNQIVDEFKDIVAPQLHVIMESDPEPPRPQQIRANLLGVQLDSVPAPVIQQKDVYVNQLGVSVGAVAFDLMPSAVALGASANLTINGYALDEVINVSFVPSDGITITGPITVSADGSAVSLPIAVAANADTGLREVVVNTNTEAIAFTSSTEGRLGIATNAPQILSMEPLQAAQGDVISLLIRGIGLTDATAVVASPADDISFAAAPVVNADGTELTIEMQVGSTAVVGNRVITVVTPVGNSGLNATAANTFTIVPLE